jgi:hypothetical protein
LRAQVQPKLAREIGGGHDAQHLPRADRQRGAVLGVCHVDRDLLGPSVRVDDEGWILDELTDENAVRCAVGERLRHGEIALAE